MFKIQSLSKVYLTEYFFSVNKLKTKYLRDKIDKADARRTKATDSLLNFETVKYFNAEEYEMKRYIEGISNYQTSNKKVFLSTLCLNFGQNLINIVGQLIGCLLAAFLVANQDKTIGKIRINLFKLIS